MSHTTCVCKDAEDVEQNNWTAWPDHPKKKHTLNTLKGTQ